nr:NUDIX domain-containing protein [Actinomycetota bacterium]
AHDRPHSYHLPGGPQITGETLAQAACRATVEATGVDIEITGLVGIYSDPSDVVRRPGEGWCQELSVCFQARPVGGDMGADGTFHEPLWVEPERLDGLTVPKAERARVTHVLAERDRPYFT